MSESAESPQKQGTNKKEFVLCDEFVTGPVHTLYYLPTQTAFSTAGIVYAATRVRKGFNVLVTVVIISPELSTMARRIKEVLPNHLSHLIFIPSIWLPKGVWAVGNLDWPSFFCGSKEID